MSNSPLVSFTKLSPNHYGLRPQKIDTITPHCIVGHLNLQTLGSIFAKPSSKASSNYGIDDQGRIGMYVEEKNGSWCTSSKSNDQRAVTIEIASDKSHPYKITDKALQGFVDLSVDICKRNGIPKLLWKADPKLVGQVDKQNITVHRWFANKSCPGDYIFGQLDEIAAEVNKKLNVRPAQGQEYQIRCKTSTLCYQKGPGINYETMGVIYQKEVYMIVEEAFGLGSSKWGKLKSGAGWIPLDFCIKV